MSNKQMNSLTSDNKARWIAALSTRQDVLAYLSEQFKSAARKKDLCTILELGFSDSDWEELRDWLSEAEQSQTEINEEEGRYYDRQRT